MAALDFRSYITLYNPNVTLRGTKMCGAVLYRPNYRKVQYQAREIPGWIMMSARLRAAGVTIAC